MPVVIRLHLKLTAPAAVRLENAPQQGWFLKLAEQIDPQWSAALHPPETAPKELRAERRAERRPYALSPFYHAAQTPLRQEDRIGDRQIRSGNLHSGQILSLRIALADDATAHRLLLHLQNARHDLPLVRNAPCRLHRVPQPTPDDPDVRAMSWQELAQHPPVSRLALEFSTPTVFQSNDIFEPLPHLDRLFAEWQLLWQAHAGFLPEGLPDAPESLCRISAYHLQTQPARLKDGIFIGFVGTLDLTPLPGTSPVQRAALASLASVSDFFGMGLKTTMGLGQTRLHC